MSEKQDVLKNCNAWKCTTFKEPSWLSIPEVKVPSDLVEALSCELKEDSHMTQKCQNYISCIKRLPNLKLEEHNYFVLLKLCLYVEDYKRQKDFKKNDMTGQTITKIEDGARLFKINVPHLDDDDKFVNVDDFVYLKGDRKNTCQARVVAAGRKCIKVSATEKFVKAFKADDTYDVRFRYMNWSMRCCHYALHLAVNNNFKSTLFPPEQKFSKPAKCDLMWFNKNVESNPEQQQAIANILGKTAFPAPYILFGPPGTGKTATLVETICQIWFQGSSKRVLVCTPSNAAADEITTRLMTYIPVNNILRMYAPSRKLCDVKDKLQPCANFVDEQACILPKEIVAVKKIIITTLISCMRLFSLQLRSNYFDYLFIDESSQAIEPEVLIPLSLIYEKSKAGTMQGQVILSGDPWQLGPVVMSPYVEQVLGKSMLERLLEHELYQKDSKKKFNSAYITQLVKNYRSHPDILYVSNKQFYDNSLQCCGGEYIKNALKWSELPNPQFPLIFHAVYGTEEKISTSTSSFNDTEISVVMKYLRKLIDKRFTKKSKQVIRQKDIGIVSPFKLQQLKIERELQRRRWDNVSVGTVEIFQGQEKEVIILTTVRSKLFVHDDVRHIGFLSNPKRFNVALTRAKSLLIIVGNPNILRTDPYWRELISHCEKNNAFVKDFKKPSKKNVEADDIFGVWK